MHWPCDFVTSDSPPKYFSMPGSATAHSSRMWATSRKISEAKNEPGTGSSVHSTVTQNAVFPQRLERVAEDFQLTFFGRVRGVEHQCAFAFSSPAGTPSPSSPSTNSYATPGLTTLSTHVFMIAGRLTPPVGVDDDNAVGPGDFTAMCLYGGVQSSALKDFRVREHGLEALGVKVVKNNVVPFTATRSAPMVAGLGLV